MNFHNLEIGDRFSTSEENKTYPNTKISDTTYRVGGFDTIYEIGCSNKKPVWKGEGTATYNVTHDGEMRYEGTKDQCWVFILRHQSQSVDWAMKYEGWKITNIGE